MSSDAGRVPAPFTAVGRVEPHPPPGFTLRRDDFGAFRAIEPGTDDLVVFRPTAEGLFLERSAGRELVPWSAIRGLTLSSTDAGRAGVPTVSVHLTAGPSLDYADALAPGAGELPLTLGPGRGHLLRVERCRMLTAAIASAAGLAPATTREFQRGPRGVGVPELTLRPRVLPRWAPLVLLALSVAAFVLAFGVRWGTACLVMSVFVAHEMGHAFVMRRIGMKVRGFLFVPLLGAATVPEHSFSSRWDEARVSLAGPVTGLPTAGVFALFLFSGHYGWVGRGAVGIAVFSALAVNLLNLLPVLPLDGGRVLTCLTAGLPAFARWIAALVPIAVLAVLAFLHLPTVAFLGSVVFLGFAVALTRSTLQRLAFLDWMRALPTPPEFVRAAVRDVTFAFTGLAREDADGGVTPTQLSASQVGVVLAVYAAEAVALFVAAAFFLDAYPWILDQFRAGG